MKVNTILIMAALTASGAVFAADVNIERAVLGSGTPVYNNKSVENAKVVDNAKVENNILHSPQYMPYYPTSAVVWPRVVEVPCIKTDTTVTCQPYNWNPSMGRGEYLFITPKIQEPPVTEMIVITKTVPVIKEVLVEVPPKKKMQ